MALVALDTAIKGNDLYCYNTEGDRNSFRMGWTLLELQMISTVITQRAIETHSEWDGHCLSYRQKQA
jgi:hypothetical protein